MASGPQKADIEAVFQRLRALPTNKVSSVLMHNGSMNKML